VIAGIVDQNVDPPKRSRTDLAIASTLSLLETSTATAKAFSPSPVAKSWLHPH
jgi:hypothetical protein